MSQSNPPVVKSTETTKEEKPEEGNWMDNYVLTDEQLALILQLEEDEKFNNSIMK